MSAPFADAAAAAAYLEAGDWRSCSPGLERIRALLRELGDPQRSLRFVHVAGTDGKGSTCACLASVLEAAGYRTGLYTSPHLERLSERFRVNGAEISDGALTALAGEVRDAAERLPERPTEFELLTALGFLHFLREGCGLVVLEVGLGGEWDASNVIDPPELAVITAMGMDHAEILGPTLSDIARAKAGIIKPGCPVVSCGGQPEADAVIRRRCAETGAELTEVDFSRLRPVSLTPEGSVFNFLPYRGLRLPLAGGYQLRNAATAVTALEALARRGWRIPERSIAEGLARVRWPGRMELLRRRPAFLLDGAHNPHGAQAAAESLRQLFPGREIVFLMGVMADKDLSGMIAALAPLARCFVAVCPDNPRALDAGALRESLSACGRSAAACGSVEEGVRAAEQAAGPDGVVCALGSLYFSGDVRRAVEASD